MNKLEGLLIGNKKFKGQIKSLKKFNIKKGQCCKLVKLYEMKLNFPPEEITEN